MQRGFIRGPCTCSALPDDPVSKFGLGRCRPGVAPLLAARHSLGFILSCRLPATPSLAQAGRRYHDPLPHRNLLLLSLAASFAGGQRCAMLRHAVLCCLLIVLPAVALLCCRHPQCCPRFFASAVSSACLQLQTCRCRP